MRDGVNMAFSVMEISWKIYIPVFQLDGSLKMKSVFERDSKLNGYITVKYKLLRKFATMQSKNIDHVLIQ